MEFKAEYRSYTTRYFGGPSFVIIMVFGFFLHWLFKDFSLSELLGKIFLGDQKSTVILVLIMIFWQIIGYFSTNKNPKILILDQDSLTFYFFKYPSLTIKYSEIESLEYTKDIFKNFEFTLNNGKKKMIYSTLSNARLAFEEIHKKIKQ